MLALLLIFFILQKLCFNDIRRYYLVDDTNYQCTAANVGGSTYGSFSTTVSKFIDFVSIYVISIMYLLISSITRYVCISIARMLFCIKISCMWTKVLRSRLRLYAC